MKLIHIIVTPKGYEDRLRMISAAGRLAETNLILTREGMSEDVALSNTRVIFAPAGIRGPAFWWWAARVANEEIRRDGNPASWTVVEYVVGIATFFLKLFLRAKVRTAVLLVTCNFTLLRELGWAADNHGGKLSLRQHWSYFWKTVGRCCVETVSVVLADIVMANCGATLDPVRKLFPRKEYAVLPNAVSSNATQHRPANVTPGKDKPLNLLYAGILQPAKGIGLLLDCVKSYVRAGGECTLTLIGGYYPCDGPWVEALLAQAKAELGTRLVRINQVPHKEMAGYYANCDIFVFPSYYEGSPRAVLEALSHGCPIVATDLPGIRVLDPNGEAVRYFRRGDLQSFTKCIRDLAASPELRSELGNRARSLAASFTPERGSTRLLDVLERSTATYTALEHEAASV